MKKLTALLLAAILVFALCACGGGSAKTPPPAETAEEPSDTNDAEGDVLIEGLPEEDAFEESTVEETNPFADLDAEYTIDIPVYEVDSTKLIWDYPDIDDVDVTEYSDFVIDEHGRLAYYKEGRLGNTLEYNDSGLVVREIPDTSGRIWGYEYDDNGYMIRSTNTSPKDPDDVRVNEMVNDEMGNQVERYFNGELIYSYENQYDEDGRLILLSKTDAEDGDTLTWEFEYDALGRIVTRTETNYNGDGTLDSAYTTACTYDDMGYLTRSETEKTYDEDGETGGDTRETNWTIAGYYTVDSSADDRILPRSEWTTSGGFAGLPSPDSVFSGIEELGRDDSSFTYSLDNTGFSPTQAYEYFSSAFIGYPPTHSVCESANYAYWVYLGALNSLGYETRINDRGCMVLSGDGTVLAEISRETDETDGYLMIIHVI